MQVLVYVFFKIKLRTFLNWSESHKSFPPTLKSGKFLFIQTDLRSSIIYRVYGTRGLTLNDQTSKQKHIQINKRQNTNTIFKRRCIWRIWITCWLIRVSWISLFDSLEILLTRAKLWPRLKEDKNVCIDFCSFIL